MKHQSGSQRLASLSCAALVIGGLAAAHQPATAGAPAANLSVRDGWPIVSAAGVDVTTSAKGRPVDVTVDGKSVLTGDAPFAVVQNPDGEIDITYAVSQGTLVEKYVPFAAMGPGAWLRSTTYTNTTSGTEYLTGAVMRIAPNAQSGNAPWNPGPFWMVEASGNQTLHIAYKSADDFYSIKGEDGFVETSIGAQWRLAAGQSAQIGSEGLWVHPGNRDDFRPEAQRWYEAIGIHVPRPHPDWLANAVLYEASAGGHVESRFSDVGGFDAFAHQLDYLADLGVNAIWYNMPFTFKSPPNGEKGGWNHYDPRDYSKIDGILGGPDAFHRLTHASRERGMHVIAELVPHGGRSVQAEALKAWWTGGRDGKPNGGWGGADMDYSSPPWQAVMCNACTYLAHDFGVEGVRIDLGDGDGVNWTSPLTNHASFSNLGGSIGMLNAARKGLLAGGVGEGGRVPILIPESPDRPEYYAMTPVGYGDKLTILLHEYVQSNPNDAAGNCEHIRAVLEDEQGSLPAGAISLRTLGNHDTTLEHGRVQQRFGAGLARALFGVCLAVPGLPMLYQEEESGSFEALRKMIWARRRIPELGSGTADYEAVSFAPEVFTVVRSAGASRAIGLVNLSGNPVSGKVTLAASTPVPDGAMVFDGVSGKSARVNGNAFTWTIGPYETALLRVGKHPDGNVPAMRFAGEPTSNEMLTTSNMPVWRNGKMAIALSPGTAAWTKRVEGATTTYDSPSGRITVRNEGIAAHVELEYGKGAPIPSLVVHNADSWLVSGRTAILDDRVIRRHFPFPASSGYSWKRNIIWGSAPWGSLYHGVAPCGRLWQSLLEPLHPDEPDLAFVDGAGTGFELSSVHCDAQNTVLTDATDEQSSAPYHLDLRFYAADPDLSQMVQVFGLGKQWQMDAPPAAVAANSLHASFEITPTSGNPAARWASPRLPVERGGMRETISGNDYHQGFNGVFFPKGGKVTWAGFAAAPGVYRIEFELRHSEASATGTDLDAAYAVTVDGATQPLTWTKRGTATYGNAYFGLATTRPIDLKGKAHTVEITCTKPWTAVREHYRLIEGTEK
ncbi:MAG: alpha-amylase family glycosyl hydrolase [Capsulimonadaceae bacterium]|nr:alpha-amylase family glycosyl hydrolase [Capsulimonadaceae bacterium]